MVLAYVDTSAAMKLVVVEPESTAMLEFVRSDPGRMLLSSWLLHTELQCAASRHPRVVDPHQVMQVLRRVTLADVTRGDLLEAGTKAPLRSLDAIHLAVAMRLGVDELVTYDRELADAAERAGLRVVSPGAAAPAR